MRRALPLAVVAVAAAALTAPVAHATNECRGLMVCVPVAGPWVLAQTADEVQFQLSCPRRFVVAGLDAEVSARGVDVGFVGALGTPVNPGITTSKDAVFLGRNLRGPTAASFRPHVGCVPASGGGGRAPTSHRALAPGKPVDRRVREIAAVGRRTVTARCPAHERLAAATHAIGFYAAVPPTQALARKVRVTQRVRNGVVTLVIRSTTHAVVQLDLLCAPR